MGATNTSCNCRLAVSVSLVATFFIPGCVLSPVNPWAILWGDIEAPAGFPRPVDAQKPSLAGSYSECKSGRLEVDIYQMLYVKHPKVTGPKFRINHSVENGSLSIEPLLDFDKKGRAVGAATYESEGPWWRRRLTFRVPKTYAYLSVDKSGDLIGYNEESRHHFVCRKLSPDSDNASGN